MQACSLQLVMQPRTAQPRPSSNLPPPLLNCLLPHPMHPPQGSFLLFWAVYTLTLATGIAVGYLMAALSPNMDVANAALPAYVTTLLFFAGQLCTYDAMPAYWGWYSRCVFLCDQ